MKRGQGRAGGASACYLVLSVFVLGLGLFAAGCEVGPQGPGGPIGTLHQGLCNPGNGGGDFGCACTDNTQCNNFDDDTRLIICDVPAMAAVGTCIDCAATMTRSAGCFCAVDTDCAAGLRCDGRTCQALRNRGEFCLLDGDCGSDMLGAMTCLPTKHWCGPGEDGSYCDFNTDCLSGTCSGAGTCTSGMSGVVCTKDADCMAPLVCDLITNQCIDKQADGQPCTRNAECINQCNSFIGVCLLGDDGQPCTMSNPDSDCTTGFTCTSCGGAFTCRAPGTPCS